MSKWNLIIDVGSCENCQNCVVSVRDEFTGNDFPGYAAAMPATSEAPIRILRRMRGAAPMVDVTYLPVMCNHCDDAPCQKAAPDAIAKRTDGLVVIDPVKAQNRRKIVGSCPYGAIVWNEEKKVPQTWIFDAHLLDDGAKQPRIQQVCPTDVFEAVKLEDEAMAKRAARENLRTLESKRGASPRVWYRNLDRWESDFLGGSVAVELDGVVDCAAGVEVALMSDGATLATARTDEFGDFRFDRLRAEGQRLEVEVRHPAGAIRRSVELTESRFLGEFRVRLEGRPA